MHGPQFCEKKSTTTAGFDFIKWFRWALFRIAYSSPVVASEKLEPVWPAALGSWYSSSSPRLLLVNWLQIYWNKLSISCYSSFYSSPGCLAFFICNLNYLTPSVKNGLDNSIILVCRWLTNLKMWRAPWVPIFFTYCSILYSCGMSWSSKRLQKWLAIVLQFFFSTWKKRGSYSSLKY